MQDYVARFIESPSFKPNGRSFDFLDWGVLYPVSKKFIFCMAVSVYEVVRVAGFTKKPATRLISEAIDFINAKSHAREKSLLVF